MSEQATHDWIRKTIAANDVVTQMLGHLGVPYKDVNVLDDASIRDGIKSFTNWPTIPQLYIKGEFIGGCDIIREMFQAGELHTLIHDKGIPHTNHSHHA
jgi:monothiol glutaredoxin